MSTNARRPGQARRTRAAQRWFHLVSGALVLAFVYLTPDADSILVDAVRWIVFPTLAATGVAMWQAPRIRRLRRRLAAA